MKRKKIIAGMMAAGLLVSCVAIPSVAAMSKFIDVRDDAWYADAVNVVSGHNMVRGTGNGQFAPNAALTRAELVQILYNHAGKPATRGSSSFTDVVSSAWYSDAVQWAAESGIVHGTGGNQFQPEGLVTREQFAVLLYHYAMNTGASPLVDIQLLRHYHDGSTVSSWVDRLELMSDFPRVRGNCSTPEIGEIGLASNPMSKARQFEETGLYTAGRYYNIYRQGRRGEERHCLDSACPFWG